LFGARARIVAAAMPEWSGSLKNKAGDGFVSHSLVTYRPNDLKT
jgi:hypothetical protein